jgi:hypothetical protein
VTVHVYIFVENKEAIETYTKMGTSTRNLTTSGVKSRVTGYDEHWVSNDGSRKINENLNIV